MNQACLVTVLAECLFVPIIAIWHYLEGNLVYFDGKIESLSHT